MRSGIKTDVLVRRIEFQKSKSQQPAQLKKTAKTNKSGMKSLVNVSRKDYSNAPKLALKVKLSIR